MNHRQENQSTALEIVNITELIITITEQILPMTQQIESKDRMNSEYYRRNNRLPTKYCTGITKNHTYMARNNGLHRQNCTYMIENNIH